MSSLAFVTHPSVRIKGTENSYTPSQCLDDRCPVKAPHLHCPFCVKTDAYQDPVILKAHYRVKHVDKGIEFAGLKILRCCDQCDIIGIIKGEKRFKGAHWHCYRCRNGFNRRDEAIKHYKTHFRNPQTTFQIQITQDLNSPPEVRPHEEHISSQDAFVAIENPVQEIIHPSLSQTGLATSDQGVIATGTLGSRRNGVVKKIKVVHDLMGKEEPVDPDEETIMIIQGDQIDSAFANHLGEFTVLNRTVDPNLSWEIRFRLEEEEKNIYKAKAEEYKNQVNLLQQQVADLESQLAMQTQLKLQELMDILNSGDFSKQGLAQQLIKFLEHCHFQSPASVTVIQDDSQLLLKQHGHSRQEETLIEGLEHNAGSLVDPFKSLDSETQHLESDSGVTHLSEIPEGYHVVCTTAEGHVVVTRTVDSPDTPIMSEGDPGLPAECLDSCSADTSISASVSEANEVLFSQVIHSHIKGDPSLSAGVLPPGAHAELTEGDQDCLMEVVAAADGLASLGHGVPVATADHGMQPCFVVDIDKSHQVESSPSDNCDLDARQPVDDVSPAKRTKIT